MTKNNPKGGENPFLKKLLFVVSCLGMFCGFVIAVISIQWLCWEWIETNIPESERGTFGDMFGSVNTLFSGLAFAGVLFTIVLQGSELSATRTELKLSREAHQENSKLMDEQLKVLQKTLEIEQVRLDQQFSPIFVPQIPEASAGRRVVSGNGEYAQCIKNKGKPIVNVLIEKLYRESDDPFSTTEIPFVGSEETFCFTECAKHHEEHKKYHTLTYNTLDGRLWRTTLVSEFANSGRLRGCMFCSVAITEELKTY